MGRPATDLTGQRFGRLLVLTRDGCIRRNAAWLCQCDCGTRIRSTAGHLRGGSTQSCGCYKIDVLKQHKTKHGLARTRLYNIWSCMKDRCTNTNNKTYAQYGGRGIQFHPSWAQFSVFADWAFSRGYTKELTIERKDVNGDYTPENCVWIPQNEQSLNRQNSLVINGIRVARAARKLGISMVLVQTRLRRGWCLADALGAPKCGWPRPTKGRGKGERRV